MRLWLGVLLRELALRGPLHPSPPSYQNKQDKHKTYIFTQMRLQVGAPPRKLPLHSPLQPGTALLIRSHHIVSHYIASYWSLFKLDSEYYTSQVVAWSLYKISNRLVLRRNGVKVALYYVLGASEGQCPMNSRYILALILFYYSCTTLDAPKKMSALQSSFASWLPFQTQGLRSNQHRPKIFRLQYKEHLWSVLVEV